MGLIDEILPRRRMGSRSRRVLTALLLMAPLAYGAGIWLIANMIRSQDVVLSVSRSQAIQIARDYAGSKGWDVSKWTVFSAVQPDETLHVYYRTLPHDFADKLRRQRPAMLIRVVFLSDDEEAVFEASLTPDGDPIGFSARVPESAVAEFGGLRIESTEAEDAPSASEEPDLDAARELAAAQFRERSSQIGFAQFAPAPSVQTDRTERSLVRKFTWRGQIEGRSEANLNLAYQIETDRVVSEELSVSLDPLYISRELESQSAGKFIMWAIFAISAAFFSIYAFVLYVRKALQKEISHSRTIAVGVTIGGAFSLVALAGVLEMLGIQFKRPPSDPVFALALVSTVLIYLILGLWIGMFWGSSEGEVREAHPNKLASLDALILGKIFSRNVARSSVIGALLGGWLLLANALAQLPWADTPQFGLASSKYLFLMYSRFPGLLSLLTPLTTCVPVVAIGLLMPLTFSHRQFASPRNRRLVFVALALVGCSWIGLNLSPWAVGLSVTLVMTAALLISFQEYDLLVSLAMLSAYAFTTSMVALAAITPFGWFSVGVSSIVVVFILTVHAYCAARGKEYREEEVRPLYAENLAQRLSMQAEVSAAREAQLRLTPQEIPQMEGFSLDACCQPGRVVGGDFYDFFPAGRDQLGLFLAEGGGSGLSSALTIAYAKGLILPMLSRDPSPEVVLGRLMHCMRELIESRQEQFGFLFGLLENETGVLRYARHGPYPRLIDASSDGPGALETESELSVGSAIIRTGQLQITAPGALVLFTNGIVDVLETSQIHAEAWISQILRRHPGAGASELKGIFLNALAPLVEQARRRGVEDDISAIFLHAERAEPKEQVA